MPLRIQKRFITLIELMIVMTIISVIAAVVGINVAKILRQERFSTAVITVTERLQQAQERMLILGEDVIVTLSLEDGHLEITDTIQRKLPRRNSVSTRIRGIEKFIFTHEDGSESENDLRIEFRSNGSRMTKGRLEFLGPKNAVIDLSGYPTVISSRPKDASAPLEIDSFTLYPREVREALPDNT
jgi:prepilin-type N-terminal cleavage/methylation domain-containing protein